MAEAPTLKQPKRSERRKGDYVTIEKAAALEGKAYLAMQKRLKRACVACVADPADSRRKLVPLGALSAKAQQAWLKEQVSPASNPQESRITVGNLNNGDSILAPARTCPDQPSLPFRPATALEGARTGVARKHEEAIHRWTTLLAQCSNHGWKAHEGELVAGYAIRNNHDWICALSKLYGKGFSISRIYEARSAMKAVLSNKQLSDAERSARMQGALLPKPRPGRSGHSFFSNPENFWQWCFARSVYLNQAALSIRRTHELLLDEIAARERAAKGEALYERPTIHQMRSALAKLPQAERIMGRAGEKAYSDRCAPYISRRPPDASGQFVSTDQKCLDILVRDGAWRLGRIWTVNFVDVASERWLGGAFAPYLSGDVVMEAAAMMLRRASVPDVVQMDLGKEFIGKRFLGGVFKLSGEALFSEALGLWERLGVRVVKAIGRNPKTKPIERWHRSLRSFEQSWATWTGGSTDERPERLALIELQAKEFKAGKAPPPAIPTIEQVITAFFNWCELEWNAKHRGRGKYRQGMTPDEAWNVKRPREGWRTLSSDQVAFYTADRHFLKIARGGQVNVTLYGQTLEYAHPELLLEIGKPAEVVIDRQSLGQATVIYAVPCGTASCVAPLKGELVWGEESREEVRMRLRCIASLKRAFKRGLEQAESARELLPEARYLPAQVLAGELERKKLADSRQLFGTESETRKLKIENVRRPPAYNDDAAAELIAAIEEEQSASS